MPVGVIIIGFGYHQYPTGDYAAIPGVVVDIFAAREYALERKWEPHVITDIKRPQKIPGTITEKIVSAEIGSGVYDYVDRWPHKDSKLVDHKVGVIEGVIQALRWIAKHCEQCLIYYSGHGVDGHLVMPDHQLLSLVELRALITKELPVSHPVLILLDCCRAGAFRLPLELREGSFRLRSAPWDACAHDITVITSNGDREVATAREYGSTFTRHFFKQLRSRTGTPKLTDLIAAISKGCATDRDPASTLTQKICVYRSHLAEVVLPTWFMGEPPPPPAGPVVIKGGGVPTVSFAWDIEHCCIIMRRH